ncbi:MAG: serine/threonine protein kinase [Luteimonas sp.]|nr:serine/threonine protein kinase [Luteimonas sp.]
MDTAMELDELKQAWQTLDRHLSRQHELQWQILRDRKLDKVRDHLRPLVWGQRAQMLLGIALTVLGVACWTRNTGIPAMLVSGLLVHAFGVASAVMAGITLALVGTVDYSAPVLKIQKQMARLLHFYRFNANLCGAPWWIMWLPVVVALGGLRPLDPAAGVSWWLAGSAVGGSIGLLGTWAWALWACRRRRGIAPEDEPTSLADGADGIRSGRRLLEEIARFERE